LAELTVGGGPVEGELVAVVQVDVATLASVELGDDAAWVVLVVDVGEQVQSLGDAPHLPDGSGQGRGHACHLGDAQPSASLIDWTG
jgi:hypothetical protein